MLKYRSPCVAVSPLAGCETVLLGMLTRSLNPFERKLVWPSKYDFSWCNVSSSGHIWTPQPLNFDESTVAPFSNVKSNSDKATGVNVTMQLLTTSLVKKLFCELDGLKDSNDYFRTTGKPLFNCYTYFFTPVSLLFSNCSFPKWLQYYIGQYILFISS